MNICLLNLQNYYKKVPEKVESLERIKYEINQYNPYFNGAWFYLCFWQCYYFDNI